MMIQPTQQIQHHHMQITRLNNIDFHFFRYKNEP